MKWYEWAIIAVCLLLLYGRQLFREAVGYLCPACKQGRCWIWQATHIIKHYHGPAVWTYTCQRCGANFHQSGNKQPSL